jgi:NAD(P)-dependent dehydrogenase (short-subunit alcohol dehydrogenase family)
MSHEKELIVITGTDTGIGRSLAEAFTGRGFHVVATYLKKPGAEHATNIKLDLRNEDSISSVADRVLELSKNGYSLTCLVNNAGVAFGGAIENLPLALYRENFEVNFFGLVSLTQKMIPFLIESEGRIILNGSSAGRTAAPFLSPYVSTKFALEGFADCLRRELLPYGIRTTLLQTGGVDTPIWDGFSRQDTSFMHEKFAKTMGLFKNSFLKGPKGLSSDEAAEKIMKVFDKTDPPHRAIIAKSRSRERLIRLLPARRLDSIFAKMFEMDYGGK